MRWRGVGAASGGLAARQAIVRWAWRVFRREWRQQTLVLALLTVAVALEVFGLAAAYNLAPVREGRFGTASHIVTFRSSDPDSLDAALAAAEDAYGTIDPILSRSVPVPGSVETVEVRAQDPDGAYSGPMLDLRAGRYPTEPGEVAVTDGMATAIGHSLDIGGQLDLGSAGVVVGLVENPGDLDDEFVLVPPASPGPVDAVSLLVRTTDENLDRPLSVEGVAPSIEERGQTESSAAATGVLGAATLALLLVALIAAAAFVVVAQRRLRQLGLLAAIGATPRQLRLVMVANGAAVGSIAALLGSVAGLGVWVAVAPQMESVAGHRIDRFSLPWGLIALGMVLAVGCATAAAWWPARSMARIPVVRALSARPPRPRAARRSAWVGVVLLAVGVGSLLAGDPAVTPLLIIPGTLGTALGVVLLCPLALGLLARLAPRLPLAPRLALRDLGRYRARSGAALAAITLGLGIPVATVIAATAAAPSSAEGNLSDRQLRVSITPEFAPLPEQTPEQLAALQAAVDRMAERLGGPSVARLDVAVNPDAPVERSDQSPAAGRPAVFVGEAINDNSYRGHGLYVATPELLDLLAVDPASIDGDSEILTTRRDQLWPKDDRPGGGSLELLALPDRVDPPKIQTVDLGRHTAAPIALILPAAVEDHGWEALPFGWFLEADHELTDDELADARNLAADAGLLVEARSSQRSLALTRSAATAAGILLALGIVAITVGLIRSETAADLRTLTAAGASSSVRRKLTATTAGALAGLGGVLATAGAYIGLGAGYAGNSGTGSLVPVPVVHLAVILAGLPVLAFGAGWLLQGRGEAEQRRVVQG